MTLTASRSMIRSAVAFGVGLAIMQPAPIWACAVCFGQTDADIAKGLAWGVVALLMIVASVLAGITAFFVQAARRSSMIEAAKAEQAQTQLVQTHDQAPT